MFFSCFDGVIADITYHLEMQRKYKDALRDTAFCKGDRLRITTYKGKLYYTILSPNGNKYVGSTVTKHVQAIIDRHYYLEALRRIESNLALLNRLKQGYQSLNPNTIRDCLPISYYNISSELFELAEIPDMSIVSDEYATPAGFYEESLDQITVDGKLVRSKSENLNILIFKKLGIRFVYEGRIRINGITLYPDFKLTSPNGEKSIYHDHFGKMSDPAYRAKNSKKIKDYLDAGMIPGYDIIITFDYNGTLNAFDVEQQLKLWLNSPTCIRVENRYFPTSP